MLDDYFTETNILMIVANMFAIYSLLLLPLRADLTYLLFCPLPRYF